MKLFNDIPSFLDILEKCDNTGFKITAHGIRDDDGYCPIMHVLNQLNLSQEDRNKYFNYVDIYVANYEATKEYAEDYNFNKLDLRAIWTATDTQLGYKFADDIDELRKTILKIIGLKENTAPEA